MTRSPVRAALTTAALWAALATAAFAQQHGGHGQHGAGHHGHGAGPAQPYSGMQAREVTSLSPGEVEGLRAGRGMGLALPAELNGYPGPMHVLELAGELGLTADQRARVQDAFDRMKARAQAAGVAYVEAEKAVDAAFRSGADRESITRLVREADLKRAEKRLAHLDAHLEITPLLSEAQRRKYAELRGYGPR